MKIAIVNNHFQMGGLERVTTVVGKTLRDTHNVLFYSVFSNENFYDIEEDFFVGKSRQPIFDNKWFKLTRYQKAWEYFWHNEITVSRYLKEELESLISWINYQKIDVVIISSPIIIACINHLKEYTSAKYIAWVHNNYHTYMSNYTRKYSTSFIKGFEVADRVICLTYSDWIQYKRLNPNTSYIYNPLTLENNKISSLEETNISFTGRLSFEHKGIDYLIQVAKRLPKNWTITIAGQGSKKEINRLKKEIRLNRVSECLIFKGPLKDKQLIEHYHRSSLYLMTSRWEGMPLVLAEAMSFGLPIIAFNQTGSNEVLSDGTYGKLIPLGNIEEMIQMIQIFSDNLNLRQEYQQKSLERLKDFSIKNIITEWLEMLEELTEN